MVQLAVCSWSAGAVAVAPTQYASFGRAARGATAVVGHAHSPRLSMQNGGGPATATISAGQAIEEGAAGGAARAPAAEGAVAGRLGRAGSVGLGGSSASSPAAALRSRSTRREREGACVAQVERAAEERRAPRDEGGDHLRRAAACQDACGRRRRRDRLGARRLELRPPPRHPRCAVRSAPGVDLDLSVVGAVDQQRVQGRAVRGPGADVERQALPVEGREGISREVGRPCVLSLVRPVHQHQVSRDGARGVGEAEGRGVLAMEQLEREHAEGEDVALGAVALPLPEGGVEQLGREVVEGARHAALHGDRAGVVGRGGDAEVDELDARRVLRVGGEALADHHVLGLDVAVDDAGVVDVRERRGEVAQDPDPVPSPQRLGGHLHGERAALDEVEGDAHDVVPQVLEVGVAAGVGGRGGRGAPARGPSRRKRSIEPAGAEPTGTSLSATGVPSRSGSSARQTLPCPPSPAGATRR